MPTLRDDFKQLQQCLAARDITAVTDLHLDDSCVRFRVVRQDASPCPVSIVFTDGYPHAGAFVLGEGEQADDCFASLNESISDSAHLAGVVQKVLAALGVNADVTDRKHAGDGGGPDEAMASEGAASDASGLPGSDMEYSDADDAEEEEEEDDDDDDDGDDDDEDRDLMIEVGTKQSLWERVEHTKEEKDRLAQDQHAAESLSAEHHAVAERQIFNTREAFQMLARELSDIIRAQDPDCFADAVDGNVYCWDVHLGGFDASSPLAQDLVQCQKQHAMSMVQLRLGFLRGLHPFYPPSVEVVRPHFLGPALGVVAAHPMLQLANWDPWKPQTAVLQQLKKFLQENVRVDLSHPGNSSGGAAYSTVERMLARLEGTSQQPALRDPQFEPLYTACNSFQADEARQEALLQSAKRSRADRSASASSSAAASSACAADKPSFWKAGTGYGHGKQEVGPVWDAKAAEAAQRAQDEERQQVLRQLAGALALELGGTVGPLPTTYGLALEQLVEVASSLPVSEAVTRSILYALQYSSLLPYATSELRSASVTDMTQRAEYYCSLLEVLRQLARPATVHLLHVQVEGRSVAACIQGMVLSARQFKKMTLSHREQRHAASAKNKTPAPLAAASAASTSAGENAAQQLLRKQMSHIQAQEEAAERRELEGLLVAELVLDITARLQATQAPQQPPADAAAARQQEGASTSGASGSGGGSSSSSSASYLDALRPLQVQYLPGFPSGHSSAAHTEASGGARARMTRVLRESTGLDRLLPLTESSSIFVAVNEAQATLWKAIIIGPDDTPYAGGCFLFDIYFPPQYPNGPPLVQFKTTGAGSIRFNPNLYNDGKVCLSLLGTWSGGKGEGWNPTASTALQVLISIQSLILVEQPYFNEPGYEKNINTPAGNVLNRDYNKVIREGTIKWAMLEYLQSPPQEFADVIKTHFRLRGPAICRTIEGWVREAAEYDKPHSRRMEAMLQQLQQQVAKLSR